MIFSITLVLEWLELGDLSNTRHVIIYDLNTGNIRMWWYQAQRLLYAKLKVIHENDKRSDVGWNWNRISIFEINRSELASFDAKHEQRLMPWSITLTCFIKQIVHLHATSLEHV